MNIIKYFNYMASLLDTPRGGDIILRNHQRVILIIKPGER